MTKRILSLVMVVLLFFSFSFVIASEDHEDTFAQAEEIIKQKISCDDLSDDQLEILGDYYMEQMHPGELHEIMDERMGGEGSENLRLMHIRMGNAFYCGESGAMSGGMMDMMMGREGMIGGSMGVMGGSYYAGGMTTFNFLSWIVTILVILVLVLLIVMLFKKLLSSGNNQRRGRRK